MLYLITMLRDICPYVRSITTYNGTLKYYYDVELSILKLFISFWCKISMICGLTSEQKVLFS